MPSEPAPTAGNAVPRWLVTIGAAAIGAAILAPPRSLADPASCPGLLELVTVIASRTASDLPVATLLLWGNRLAVFAALLVFGRLLQTIGSGLVAAAALTIAVAFIPLFAPVLAPTPAAVFAAASVALLLISRATAQVQPRTASPTWACLAIALTAAMAPALTLPAAGAAAVLLWTTAAARARRARVVGAIVAAAVVVVTSMAVTLALPSLPVVGDETAQVLTCVAPTSLSIADGLRAMAGALGTVTPLAIGLALLGAFAARARIVDRSMWPSIAFAIAPAAAVCWSGAADADRTLAPALAGLWCLAAVGLGDLDAAIAPRPARHVVVLLLALAVPWQQHSRAIAPGAADAVVSGHDQLSRDRFNEVAGLLPSGAALVAEDAVTDLLARDAFRRLQRRGKTVRVVDRDAQAVGELLASSRVFALPRGQTRLQHEAIRLTDVGDAKVSGLAELHQGGGCDVAGFSWVDLPALQARAGMAAVTADLRQHWHVVMYLGSAALVELRRDGWPDRPGLGYHATAYDREVDDQRRVLAEIVRSDAAPEAQRVFSARHVTRLEIWRAAGGPEILPMGFAAPDAVIARARNTAGDAPVKLCASFPYEVRELVVR